ncbi:hypothetical protein D9615_002869 [Tricholomella constricta]|uniref:Uncharacterized protein n=1 Tax=Tricholomella constricta TaxID=117010 RepID=A0A8H5HG25_9AGAR|nr:hypothetical protein D9615_002869 [Tricholomella constricta]
MASASVSLSSRLDVVVKLVEAKVTSFTSLRKITSQTRKQFTTDIALIGLGLRTGYLVDVVAPTNPVQVFGQLISSLRLTCPEFGAVAHVYEPASDQSFIVNIPLLCRRTQEDQSYTDGISFVLLGKDVLFSLRSGPPPELTDALLSLVEDATTQPSLPPSISISSSLPRETAVPLAAVLLEYPVAYVPTSLEHPFLSNVPLDIYECVVTFDRDSAHTLLKFSCPSDLAQRYPVVLSPLHIIASVIKKFTPRIRDTTISLQVHHSTKTLDRVAL